MATIRFITRSQLNKLVPVYLSFITSRKERFLITTPYRILPEYWNNDSQRLKQRILSSKVLSEDQAKDIEDKFTQLRDFILREHFKLTQPVTKDWIKATVDKFYYTDAPGSENLTEYIERFVNEVKSGKRLASGRNAKRRYSRETIYGMTTLKNTFELFCEVKGSHNWNDINIDFYNSFIEYSYKKDCGANYIGKQIKILKSIMRAGRDEGLHDNQEIERRAFKPISEDVSNVYLTEAELNKLLALDLSKNKLYSIVRDVFLVGCYTAQRYSDYSKINKNNLKEVDGRKYIEIIQKKTGERCIIPVRPELDIILKRYDYTLPKTFEQKVNFNIKKIAVLAGITELIETEKIKGGLKVKSFVSKSELIKTHTARRTGCSLMYLSGIAPIDIMKISGHKTEREFLKYIRIGKEETAHSLSSHPYFIGNTLSVAK